MLIQRPFNKIRVEENRIEVSDRIVSVASLSLAFAFARWPAVRLLEIGLSNAKATDPFDPAAAAKLIDVARRQIVDVKDITGFAGIIPLCDELDRYDFATLRPVPQFIDVKRSARWDILQHAGVEKVECNGQDILVDIRHAIIDAVDWEALAWRFVMATNIETILQTTNNVKTATGSRYPAHRAVASRQYMCKVRAACLRSHYAALLAARLTAFNDPIAADWIRRLLGEDQVFRIKELAGSVAHIKPMPIHRYAPLRGVFDPRQIDLESVRDLVSEIHEYDSLVEAIDAKESVDAALAIPDFNIPDFPASPAPILTDSYEVRTDAGLATADSILAQAIYYGWVIDGVHKDSDFNHASSVVFRHTLPVTAEVEKHLDKVRNWSMVTDDASYEPWHVARWQDGRPVTSFTIANRRVTVTFHRSEAFGQMHYYTPYADDTLSLIEVFRLSWIATREEAEAESGPGSVLEAVLPGSASPYGWLGARQKTS